METLYFKIYFSFWLALFGACIGSFLNVVVYRLPKGSFFSNTRSYCPACGKTLKWRDLIPIVSYFILKGCCRNCGKKISLRYPLIEAASAVLAVLCYIRFGFDFRLVLSFCVLMILLAVTLIDFETMEIPNSLVLALIPFAVWAVWIWSDISIPERFIGFFVISLPMLLLNFVIKDAFGGGDIKLIAVCGFLLGWKSTLLAFFISLLIGGGYAVYLLVSGKSKLGAHIAFGPYLCLGIAIALFWGTEIVRSYISFFI